MDRLYLDDPDAVTPDEETEEQRLVASNGDEHERAILSEFQSATLGLVIIPRGDDAVAATLAAMKARTPVIYQAALVADAFEGFADFLVKGVSGYQVWDTKLARSVRPYFAIQLCCYSEMLTAMFDEGMPEKFGVILGTGERAEFRVEDFIHYYRRVKAGFLGMQSRFSADFENRPEPCPRADHGRWASHAEAYFESRDHLVRVAGISVGQIKKLTAFGLGTVAQLAAASGAKVPKLARNTTEKLAAQARLQMETREDRKVNPDAPPRFELLSRQLGPNGQPAGLAALPPNHPADVFYDMEGFPLVAGGLEYLYGVCFWQSGALQYADWWAHDRAEERSAFEACVDWVYNR